MFATDWQILETAAADLESFLLSRELYWLVKGGRLSTGNVLLSMKRLEAAFGQDAHFQNLKGEIEQTRARWRSAWMEKARREYEERLRLWTQFLNDLSAGETSALAEYKTQVRFRLMLDLLAGDVPMPSSAGGLLEKLDGQLRVSTRAGGFVWEGELAEGFDSETYWYLYRTLTVPKH